LIHSKPFSQAGEAAASTTRRTVLGAMLAGACVDAAWAQVAETYPTKPVRIMVGYGPGGTGDLTVRLVAQKLGERMGQQFIVDNRPGAGGIVASQTAQQAPADGYTLNFIAAGNFAMTPSLFKSLPFDPVKDFDMVSLIGTFGFALAVDAGGPGTTRDLIAQMKARPGTLSIGTISVGSAQYLAAETFKSMAQVNATIVPYKTTADVVRALRAGEVHCVFETISGVWPQANAGAVRILGVSEPQRFAGMPDVPTIGQDLPGYVVVGWNGLAAPARTPRAIVRRLSAEINAVVALPEIQQKFLALGVVAKGNTPEEMTALLKKDIAWWAGVIQKANIEKQ
jgi:tripartite-type tricarboxylate transporter receptor subunit TctC